MKLTVERIREAVIGDGEAIHGPFGPRPLIYADYVASGRSLDFVEDAIRRAVLPTYGNTHTETSHTGRRTTRLREAARRAVREGVGADDDHAVIFCGTGATAAADKLVRALGLAERSEDRPKAVVFVGPYEHHSNDLPWREAAVELVRIPLDAKGGICLASLERALKEPARHKLRIGAFSAASNVTGVRTDLTSVAVLLHRHGARFVCDFAAAGPYVPIRMCESAPGAGDRIDAAFISSHKFVGGPGASGILVADRAMLDCAVPTVAGGGTVSYVTEDHQTYVKDPERREEAGTPGIVENIRAGMVMAIKNAIGAERVQQLEERLSRRLLDALAQEPAIELLGPPDQPRLGIFSFNIRAGAKLLHHNYVVALLNDLFGIQARGGCSCAGPYGHSLLGIDSGRAAAHERAVERGLSAFRPGWARLGVNYFFDEARVDHIADAVRFIARHGLALLPLYTLDAQSGVWRARAGTADDPLTLDGFWDWASADAPPPPDFASCMREAEDLVRQAASIQAEPAGFDPEAEALRWFWMPHEAARECAA